MPNKLTKQDRHVLTVLSRLVAPVSSGVLASWCHFRTSSPRETAARHALKLARLGLVQKHGSPMFPEWRITDAGRHALSDSKENDRG